MLTLVAISGCNHAANPTSPAISASPSGPASSSASSPGASALSGDSSTPSVGDTSGASAGATDTTPAGPPTPDAAASELDQIQQLINDINNSLSSSDGGGE